MTMFDFDVTHADYLHEATEDNDVNIVLPRVQLIGFTVYHPPVDVDSDDPKKTHLTPLPNATSSESIIEFAGRGCYRSWNRPNPNTATIAGYLENIIKQKHWSVLRHAYATFYITGVSRTFTHELVTHAHLARSQESQRFVPANKINMVVPPLIRELAKDHDEIQSVANLLKNIVHLSRNMYSELTGLVTYYTGSKGKQTREAVRALLPNCVETRLTVSANYQAWMEFLIKRDNPHADAEMQEVTSMIYDHLIGLAPHIFAPKVRELWDESFAERKREMDA